MIFNDREFTLALGRLARKAQALEVTIENLPGDLKDRRDDECARIVRDFADLVKYALFSEGVILDHIDED